WPQRGRACEGLAHGPHVAAPGGAADRQRPDGDVCAERQWRRDRAGRGNRSDRLGRQLRVGCVPRPDGKHRAQRARDRGEEPQDCRPDLHIHKPGTDDRRIEEGVTMAIYLPGTAEDQALALDVMTPREIVAELDKYVVGQDAAKRAVAIALRNRMRRQKLPAELADDIMPKNIIMIGPTGVGKTEITRRLAKLTNSPFLKVEASKFTEVGYVGRDVESMVRDLVEIAIDMVREEKMEEVE